MITQKYDKNGNLEYLCCKVVLNKEDVDKFIWHIKPKLLVRIIDWIIVKLEQLKGKVK